MGRFGCFRPGRQTSRQLSPRYERRAHCWCRQPGTMCATQRRACASAQPSRAHTSPWPRRSRRVSKRSRWAARMGRRSERWASMRVDCWGGRWQLVKSACSALYHDQVPPPTKPSQINLVSFPTTCTIVRRRVCSCVHDNYISYFF